MKIILRNLVMIFLLMPLLMQAQRNCGTTEYLEQQVQEDPSLLQRMQQIELLTEQYIKSGTKMRADIITIPVVVHVVYKTNEENISDARIQSQLNVLNEDFRKLNSDASKFRSGVFGNINADVEIQFCLANTAPDGSATNGVTRTQTSKNSFSYRNDAIKYTSMGGHDAWPTDQYLNIWVGNLSNGLLGYAQFPGGAAATDGVVCHYAAFGSIEDKPSNETWPMFANYNLGRTTTHEVGHWLNLRHIWGDGGCSADDFVNDTPIAGTSNSGCPANNHNTCGSGSNDLPDMWENYMDYTYDVCMYAFTQGQSSRMRAVFTADSRRAALLNSAGCGGSTTPTCSAPSGLGATATDNSATLTWSAVSGASSYSVAYGTVGGTKTTTTTTNTSLSVSGLTSCTDYEFSVTADCSGTQSASSGFVQFATTGCTGGGTTCEVPGNLQTSQINPKKSRLTWDAVTGAVGYEVDYAGSITYTSNTQLNVNSGGGTWRVRTDCGNGNFSAWSTTSSARMGYTFSGTFNIYPNPASEEVIIEFGELDAAVINVTMTDLLGKRVKQQVNVDATLGFTFFDITDLQNGIYFIQINDGEKILSSSRIVVNK